MGLLTLENLNRKLNALERRCCCHVGLPLTDGTPMDTPSGDDNFRLDPSGVVYYWDGDSWEIFGTAVENEAQIKTIEVELSSADIQGMFVTPILVIPGETGKVISIVKVITSFDYGTIQYTGGGSVILRDTITTNSIAAVLMSSSSIQGSVDVITMNSGLNAANPIAISSGSDVEITNLSAAFATGDGTLKLFITYQLITI